MTTANITADALLAELAGGSEWNVSEYSVEAAEELVRRGLATIETRNVLFGRKRGGKEFSRTEVKVRLLSMKEHLCREMTIAQASSLLT